MIRFCTRLVDVALSVPARQLAFPVQLHQSCSAGRRFAAPALCASWPTLPAPIIKATFCYFPVPMRPAQMPSFHFRRFWHDRGGKLFKSKSVTTSGVDCDMKIKPYRRKNGGAAGWQCPEKRSSSFLKLNEVAAMAYNQRFTGVEHDCNGFSDLAQQPCFRSSLGIRVSAHAVTADQAAAIPASVAAILGCRKARRDAAKQRRICAQALRRTP